MQAVTGLGSSVGIEAACDALGVARASFYRYPPVFGPRLRRPIPARALRPEERQTVRALPNGERFQDCSPAAICATLLDAGAYPCSIRTMYRVLAEEGGARERRDQLLHPPYKKPALLASAPNQLWSWDITKLLGPAKWTYYYLYKILDVFSRYAVGWMVAHQELACLAEDLIAETCLKQNIQKGQLTIHADRGSPMISQSVGQLLADLGITKTHSRPHVSNDNPFSEAGFKTLKYRPDFPERFGSIEDARAHCQHFFQWYNATHRHSGIGFMTSETVHYGRAQVLFQQRADTLNVAFLANPKRFKGKVPQPPRLPTAAWINPPKPETATTTTPDPSTLNSCNQVSQSH